MERYGLPPALFSDDPARHNSEGRVMVDVGQTAFWQARQFRISHEYNVPNGATEVLRFTAPLDFVIQYQSLSCDEGAVRFRAFRSDEGTPGGSFDAPVTISGVNVMDEAPDYTRQVTIDSGGSFTPAPGVSARETIRLRVANASGQKTSVSGSAADERGLGPNTYYLLIENIAGAGAAQGVLDLRWEERPADLNDWILTRYGRYG